MTPRYIRINDFGSKFYYKDRAMTILHRENGPAIEWSDGAKEWYVNGELHREDGPAVEWDDGSKSWALHGERISEAEFKRRTSLEIVLTMDEIATKFGVDVSKLKIKK